MVVHIRELLKEIIAGTGKIERVLAEANAAGLWGKIIDPKYADQTEAIKVQRGTLYVSVSNSVLAQELSLRKSDLLGRMNNLLGKGESLKDIRFRTGTRKE